MPTTIKGHASCPECGSEQPVKFDGRKYFMNCGECRVFSNYQSKIAQARILERLTLLKPEIDLAPQPEVPVKVSPKIYKPVRASDGILSDFGDFF